jgi:hypothetical protein
VGSGNEVGLAALPDWADIVVERLKPEEDIHR